MKPIKIFFILAAMTWCLGSVHHEAFGETGFEMLFKASNQYQNVIVQEVISVDTIVIENTLKKGEKIKLIGIRGPAPEKKKKNVERDKNGFVIEEEVSPLTPIETIALDYAKNLLEGKNIRVEFDINKKDDDFNTLGYVFLIENDLFANIEILRQGYAHLQIIPPNKKYDKQFREAYQEARKEKRGFQGEF